MSPLLLSLSLLSPAHADEPLPDDPSWWEERSAAVLAGPQGCVEVRGEAELSLAFLRPGGLMGPGETVKAEISGPFQWRIVDGQWVDTRLDMKAKKREGLEVSLDAAFPITGRVGEPAEKPEKDGELTVNLEGGNPSIDVAQESGRSLNIVDDILEELQPETILSWVEPRDGGGYVLVQRAPVPGAAGDEPLEIRTAFPDKKTPTAMDVMLPRKIRLSEDGMTATLMDAQVHLRAAQTDVGLVPVEEGMSLVVGFFGFTLGVEQRIRYTAMRRCPDAG
jgi:hypothetical protein